MHNLKKIKTFLYSIWETKNTENCTDTSGYFVQYLMKAAVAFPFLVAISEAVEAFKNSVE